MHNSKGVSRQPIVLVVDDDMALRLLIVETLLEDNLAVEEAEDGVEALELFQRISPDLVLMDVKMPRMDGFTACAEMRKLPNGIDTAIVLVTGLDDIASILRAFDAGATDFMTKPVNWPLLSHRVRYLLRAGEAFRNLRQSEQRLSIAQKIAKLGNWDWGFDKDTVYCSDQMCVLCGLAPVDGRFSHEMFLQCVHPDDNEAVRATVKNALDEKKPYRLEYRIQLADGSTRIIHEQAEVEHDSNGAPVSMHGTVQDVSERRQAEEKIRFLAYYDALTGLPNRLLFTKYVEQALFAAMRAKSKVALLYIGVDRFKRINDTLGHKAGDELLKMIASSLASSVRRSDIFGKFVLAKEPEFILSRLTGDEFSILLTGIFKEESISYVARRILEMLQEPISVGGQEMNISCSIGISIYPGDTEDVEALLKNADVAMAYAKQSGGNTFKFFAHDMNDRAIERLNLEIDLKKALERDEFVLFYQPQIDLYSGKISGLEALIRWQHPERGLIAPQQFISIAEESGLIIPIGAWVLNEACRQACVWHQAGLAQIRMAVNISSHQFRQGGLVTMVKQALDDSGLSSSMLELELTESCIMQDIEATIITLVLLKELGVTLSVDDFGTGYSSMNYLKRFPLDTLKIDRSFVMDITTDPNDAAIITAIIALAGSLGLKTIAEGVETLEQLQFMRQHLCDEIQGFFISKPMPADEVERFLVPGMTLC
ncbi:MAG: EAL domain-containing protein [Proteobacteria bacterium]|nr:EAL domain-containing protein [Desulfocapsa sp.]MBU3946288.1 EAL domain-containing protein [Pseudomonadota bacterium]MCG2742515.1 EAL domain-containing protein [Desulfobacteraceae bacterium]MBU3981956.1 EAL domain-containing protein [Pseudomonadota bacterium]MBU4028175.1 EAL domain-containing protein [Pseudomonadota bacterium]